MNATMVSTAEQAIDILGNSAVDIVLTDLWHELNNPLTGYLATPAEVRGKNDGQLPNGGQQRLGRSRRWRFTIDGAPAESGLGNEQPHIPESCAAAHCARTFLAQLGAACNRPKGFWRCILAKYCRR